MHALLNGADYHFILGELLREWNQLEQAEQLLKQGMDVDQGAVTAEAEMIMRGYLALARLQQACGESTQALHTLDAFALLAQRRGFAPTLVARGAAVRAQLAVAQGDLAAAIRWAELSGLSASDELSYVREQEYLILVRVRLAQGCAQPREPYLPEALSLLERLEAEAEVKGRMRSVLEVLLLRALALQVQGDLGEARAASSSLPFHTVSQAASGEGIASSSPDLSLLACAQLRSYDFPHARRDHRQGARPLTAAGQRVAMFVLRRDGVCWPSCLPV